MTSTRKHPSFSHRLKALAGTLLLSGSLAQAADRALIPGEIEAAASVVDGDTLFLASGLKVRLSAMQAPKLPLGRPGFTAWPLAKEAKAELESLVQGQTLALYYGGQKRDRYDRALAQVFISTDMSGEPTQTGLWLQEEMIRRGYGRVYTWPDTWQDSDRLYAAERDARKNKRGIWGHEYYRIRTPDPNTLAQDVDSFQLVEGIITSSAKVRDKIYLNFGADYRTDFTIVIDRKDWKRFRSAPYEITELDGAKVRVRGWIELQNGPSIYLDHPERLEVLD